MRSTASRRHRSSAHFDVMETGYDFILDTPWSRTTATPRPVPHPPEPSVPTPSPTITVTSPRQFAHFIRQDGVTFFTVNVTDLLHYDPPCPDVELIALEPDPPSISMTSISTSLPPPFVENIPLSCADTNVEELARYTTDLEPAVCDLIREYHDVFPSSFCYADIPPMRNVKHSIHLVPDYHVHHQTPYRLSIPEDTELKRHLEEILRSGFIKPSNSPWGAPVLFARKADETLRLCINSRGLNHYTVKNSYLMPRSDELFDRLAGNRFFTKIDLRSGYHQIRVAAADQPKTAFRSCFGHYEFTVMPFRLTNAPATFQRAMNDILRDILEQYVLVYLDDILIYSRTLEQHLKHLHDVLDRLRRHGFYAKLSKCRFAQHKMNFLGHYVSDQGLHMEDTKITAIAEWPVPTSSKQFRSFLGLTNYYSNFIQGYTSHFARWCPYPPRSNNYAGSLRTDGYVAPRPAGNDAQMRNDGFVHGRPILPPPPVQTPVQPAAAPPHPPPLLHAPPATAGAIVPYQPQQQAIVPYQPQQQAIVPFQQPPPRGGSNGNDSATGIAGHEMVKAKD
ncbi:hypothetical protein CBR_g18621 [Chara braunii]|uniref:Reverse transcriptase domain-containing protein n=1 Tax=Chara braunii TaxID=69332 RepID=A0A388JT96_CHABU|nr:hypothetical protein CBR_g18621 [Chara braunii]|eukprot:GBG61026.1 hypothetical protein CBR_g18621 [Chara braunii]